MNTEISNKFAEQEARIAALEALVAAMSAKPKAAVKKVADKEKKTPSAGNKAWVDTVNETVVAMRSNGWESWTDVSGNVWAASKPATVDGRETHVFADTGKEPNYPKGGLARASYLKTRDSPEEQAKTKARAAKRAEVVAAKKSDEPAEKPKRTMSDEQKAKMKAGKEAKKAAAPAAGGGPELVMDAAAPAAAAAPPAAVVAESKPAAAVEAKPVVAEAKPAPVKKKIATKKPEPKVYDLSFNAWAFNGEDYITNERGDTLTLEGDWVGRFNGKVIDDTVERPTDIDAFLAEED